MPLISVNIPQIGEGLQEARLVSILKQPGDRVKRDEPIYQMETDKAVMDVESPYEGTLVEWLAPVDSVLAIGAAVAKMDVAGGPEAATEAPATSSEPERVPAAREGLNIPPRTRAYAKEKGVGEGQLAELAANGKKLMPEDIDAFLASGPAGAYSEKPVPPKQRLLASRLVRGSALVVPGTISVPVGWEAIERERAKVKTSGSDFRPSTFTMFAYAVTQALKAFPAFRSTLQGDERLRTYDHVALGIAVGLPDDELVLAVVEDADTLTWHEFAGRCRERIELARTGKDQATEAVTVSLTNMQHFGLRDAVAVVVPPACATIFLGASYMTLDPESDELRPLRVANVAITFDHRLINGVGAANFLTEIKRRVEEIGELVESSR